MKNKIRNTFPLGRDATRKISVIYMNGLEHRFSIWDNFCAGSCWVRLRLSYIESS